MKLITVNKALVRGTDRLIAIPDEIGINVIKPLMKEYGDIINIPRKHTLSTDCLEQKSTDGQFVLIQEPIPICDVEIYHPAEVIVIKRTY